jgi:hypothetical protein
VNTILLCACDSCGALCMKRLDQLCEDERTPGYYVQDCGLVRPDHDSEQCYGDVRYVGALAVTVPA